MIIRNQPLFSAPQQSQTRIVFLLPVELSRRFPESVQNTRDPMADILHWWGRKNEFKLAHRLVIHIHQTQGWTGKELPAWTISTHQSTNIWAQRSGKYHSMSCRHTFCSWYALRKWDSLSRNDRYSSEVSPVFKMETNGYPYHHGSTNGTNGAFYGNSSGIVVPRILTVDEALPYSPFSSVVPFNSGMAYAFLSL